MASAPTMQLVASMAVLEPEAGDQGDPSLLSVFAGLIVLLGLLWGLGRLMRTEPIGSKPRRNSKPRSAKRDQSAPTLRRLRRRVIQLHAVTPGQSRYEYNVGDDRGTRGSALVRAW